MSTTARAAAVSAGRAFTARSGLTRDAILTADPAQIATALIPTTTARLPRTTDVNRRALCTSTAIVASHMLSTRRALPPAWRALVTAPPVAPFILPSPLPTRLLTLSLLRQQQRSRTLQQARQRCRDLDGRHFVFSLKLFDDRP